MTTTAAAGASRLPGNAEMSPEVAQAARGGDSKVYGLSEADALTTDAILDVGRRHPSSHGMTRLRLGVDAGMVTSAEVLLGSMHRGAEKLFESRDYRQVLALTDRHDWLSAPGSEAGAAMAMEELLGIDVPRRAQLLRMLAAELSRVAAHSAFLAEFPWRVMPTDADEIHEMVEAMRAVRERCMDVLCELTGARMHVMWTVIGGVRNDASAQWLAGVAARIDATRAVRMATDVLARSDVAARLRGVGGVTAQQVSDFAMSGVLARATGVRIDARTAPGYALYAECADVLNIPTDEHGDALARLQLLVAEIAQSLALIDRIVELLAHTESAVNVPLPKVVRLPEGSVYSQTENALGINGYWLVSGADKMPLRLKIRSASFNNLAALESVLVGMQFDDVVPTLATWFFLSGDADR